MGEKRNTASMLMVMGLIAAIIAFTQPILINSRVLLPSTSMAENQIDTSDETIHGFESVGTSSSLESLSSIDRRLVVVKNQVYVLVSGPSDKGTGHKFRLVHCREITWSSVWEMMFPAEIKSNTSGNLPEKMSSKASTPVLFFSLITC
ncbi:hypothetical protein RHSIM_Rhsim08G0097600 [Rhododendron simsii]|uniref:Uncharacterized protein n=1 Tax=Rhododendron simsii TaxID=118357 RepID=A0A834LD42_RHOSS|nr:hypothetical protein RHSIM_Rhsim08G0097600 [Rhododendron simsii]